MVNRDFFSEIRCYTTQNYLKKIKTCDITESHSESIRETKNGHIALHCYDKSGMKLFLYKIVNCG